MPTFQTGKNTRIIFANPTANTNYDVSQYFNDVSISRSIESAETTTFQNSGFKTYVSGLRDGTISLSGFYEGSTNGLDAILTEAISNDGDDGIIVFFDGGTVVNSLCAMAKGIEAKYDLKSPVSGVVSADTEVMSDGGVWRGRGQFKTITTSYNTTAYDNGQASLYGGLLIMGCTELTGTTPTVSLAFQHSVDGSSWVTPPNGATLATESGVGTTVVKITGTVFRYTRLSVTVTGTSPSATIYFGFARY